MLGELAQTVQWSWPWFGGEACGRSEGVNMGQLAPHLSTVRWRVQRGDTPCSFNLWQSGEIVREVSWPCPSPAWESFPRGFIQQDSGGSSAGMDVDESALRA